MSAKKAYQLCAFFFRFEVSMIEQGRMNIAAFARRQHEKYFRIAMKGMSA